MSQRGKGRAKKCNSTPDLFQTEETASSSSSTATITSDTTTISSVEETSFVLEDSNDEVIHTPETSRRRSRITKKDFNMEKQALHLNFLSNKAARYESHISFLMKCMEEKLIPEALKYSIEPSIGNHDEEFINEWYEIQKECSRKLIQHTVKFCETTLSKTNNSIDATQQ